MNALLLVLALPLVSWVNPVENVDGSPLTDLQTVRLYWGVSSRAYSDSVDALPMQNTDYDLGLGPGSYFVAATAIDSDLNESAYSNEVLKFVQAADFAANLGAVCVLPCEAHEQTMLVVETGSDVPLTWDGTGSFELEMLEFPPETGAVPVANAQLNSNAFTWVPSRAGLFYVRVRACTACPWISSSIPGATTFVRGFIVYARLAAPTGGGIE